MKLIYLAARYSRRLEIVAYAQYLRDTLGPFCIQATWLDGTHEAKDGLIGSDMLSEAQRQWALQDLEDIDDCDTVISFTESPDSPHGRGGRHVEFGYALAKEKRVIVVGPRENVFHYHPDVAVFASWNDFKTYIEAVKFVQSYERGNRA